MGRRLTAGVLVRDPATAEIVWFGPSSGDVPEWVAEQAPGAHLWADEEPEAEDAPPAGGGPEERPAGNASRDEWIKYAQANGYAVDALDGLGRDQIRDLFDN